MFNKIKASQLAAFFAKEEGGKINYMKLIKLMYLAERTVLLRDGYLMVADDLFFLPHGPILSRSLDMMKYAPLSEDAWTELFNGTEGYDVSLKTTQLSRDDFDRLSDSEFAVANEIWDEFKLYDQFRLEAYTHMLPEWNDPGTGRLPISIKDMACRLGFSLEAATDLENQVKTDAYIDELFAVA